MQIYHDVPCWIKENPEDLKTKKMSNEEVSTEPLLLVYVPEHFKIQEMCNKAVTRKPYALDDVPDHCKMDEM